MNAYLPKLLITGGSGQLASAIIEHPLCTDFTITTCSHQTMDIGDMDKVNDKISELKPDIVINTAAYVAVDKAEHEKELALHVNHLGTSNLAIACEQHNIPLIHISTDYVFDGKKSTPYLEDDEVNPINVYGLSKWLGEQAVRDECTRHIILRVSAVFSEHGQNFYKKILSLAREKRELTITSDIITSPTYAGDIAGAILTIAKEKQHWGTYHYCSADATSWYEFAKAIIAEAKLRENLLVEEIKPVLAVNFPTPAKRPAYSVLDCNKIKKQFGIEQPSWKNHLDINV